MRSPSLWRNRRSLPSPRLPDDVAFDLERPGLDEGETERERIDEGLFGLRGAREHNQA